MNAVTLVFINGVFSESQSNRTALAPEITFRAESGIFLQVAKNYTQTSPIYLKFISRGKPESKNVLHNTLILEENSHLILIEEHLAEDAENYSSQVSLELQVNTEARMDYYKLRNESKTAMHHATIIIEQKESSCVEMFFADCGSRSSHTDLQIKLREAHAVCHLRGFYLLAEDEQQIDNNIAVEHMALHGTSSMLYKGILDKKSRAGFIGKVHVHEMAQHTIAHQANHNLLLSAHAKVSSQPQLEIYADDIKCTHGATVGQLDNEALFYLQSRGIEKELALKLLATAFTTEIMHKISDPDIRTYVQQRVRQHA